MSVELKTMAESDNVERPRTLISVIEDVDVTILDCILSRFTIIKDHHVRGKWRTIICIAVIITPLAVMMVMMWYQLHKSCITNSAFYPLVVTSTDFTSGTTINSFLDQSNIHYCFSMVSQQSNMLGTPNTLVENWHFCQLSSPHSRFNDQDTCSPYSSVLKSIPHGGHTSCANSNYTTNSGSVAVFYAQCVPVETAVVNSIQISYYFALVAIMFYLTLRVYKKAGCAGLFVKRNWDLILSNKKNDLKSEDIHGPLRV